MLGAELGSWLSSRECLLYELLLGWWSQGGQFITGRISKEYSKRGEDGPEIGTESFLLTPGYHRAYLDPKGRPMPISLSLHGRTVEKQKTVFIFGLHSNLQLCEYRPNSCTIRFVAEALLVFSSET